MGVKEALPMVIACGHASNGQERDLRQGPMTARKAEPDGCPRVVTAGYVQKLGTQGHPQLEPKGDYHGQGFNQKLGQTRNELSGALNCGRNRHRNVSKPRNISHIKPELLGSACRAQFL